MNTILRHSRLVRAATLATVLASVLTGVLHADEKSIHIAGGRTVNFTWEMTDGAGYRWDISSNGHVNDGTNDTYDGGMGLYVNDSSFSWGSTGTLSKDGREIEIGPWNAGNISVYRRIYVDPKLGYCRWIDIFRNTSNAEQSIRLKYHSNMGSSTQLVHTTSGKAELTKKDWGVVTGASSGSSRPAVAHIFASRNAKNKPSFQFRQGDDNLYYYITINVPANKAVALCLFEAQRRPFDIAQKLLKDFNVPRELRKVPGALRRIILNMGGTMLTLGSLEFPRHDKYDLVVTANGNELLGTILNRRFVIETFYGKLDLPAERVVGLVVPGAGDRHVQAALVDGQVVAGALLNAPLKLKLADGNHMSLPPEKISSAAYRISADRPEEIAARDPVIILRAGQQLFFRAEDIDLTFHTEHGQPKLSADNLKIIHLDTPDGGLHRAVFSNGSVLSGLLVADRLKLRLQLGPTLEIPRSLVWQLAFPAGEQERPGQAVLTFRNEDELFGRIAQKALTIKTQFADVTVASADIAEMRLAGGSPGLVNMKLRNGTTVSGRLKNRFIRFKIAPGPELNIFVGHITKIVRPKPAAEKSPPTTTKPATTTAPTSNSLTEPAFRR